MRKKRFSEKQIVHAIGKSKGLIFLAAQHLGCNPATIHVRANQSQNIREAIETERGRVLDFAEVKLIEAVQDGEAWAICFILKTLGKSRGYIERQEIKAEAKITVLNNVEEISDAELDYLIARELAAKTKAEIGPQISS